MQNATPIQPRLFRQKHHACHFESFYLWYCEPIANSPIISRIQEHPSQEYILINTVKRWAPSQQIQNKILTHRSSQKHASCETVELTIVFAAF